MRITLFFFFFLLIPQKSYTQYIQIGIDSTLCEDDQLGVIGIQIDSNRVVMLNNPTYLNLGDDWNSPIIDIGFDFTFYDSTYSQLTITTNGVIHFFLTGANGPTQWIPNPIEPGGWNYPSIYMPFIDLNPRYNGLSYQTIGDTPNRTFVVFFNNPSILGGNTTNCWNSSLILHETTNEIEMHIDGFDVCGDCFYNNHAIQGTLNGIINHIAPGRNYENDWSAYLDGKRWTPIDSANYTISDIPYKVVVDSTYGIGWGNTLGQFFPFSDTLAVTGNNSGNVGYYLGIRNVNYCSETVIALSDTSWINMDYTSPQLIIAGDFCNANAGAIISSNPHTDNSSYFWTNLNTFSDSLYNLTQGQYIYLYTGNNGCQEMDSISIVASDTLTYVVNDINCGDNQLGSIAIITQQADVSFIWEDHPANVTNQMSNLHEGNYVCYASSNFGCFDTIYAPIRYSDSLHFELDAIYYSGECASSASVNYLPYVNELLTISLNNNPRIDLIFNGLTGGTYTVYAQDVVGCTFRDTFEINYPIVIEATAVVTPETISDDGTIHLITVEGGVPPYHYQLNGENFGENQFFDSLTSGSYFVAIYDVNSCIGYLDVEVPSIVSTHESDIDHIRVFPNPTTGNLNIENLHLSSISSFHLTTLSGQTVNVDYQIEKDSIRLNTSQLDNGMYFLTVLSEEKKQVLPILKQ